MAALELALDALEDANARYLQAARQHVGDLIELGLPSEVAEHALRPLDRIEQVQRSLVEYIRTLDA